MDYDHDSRDLVPDLERNLEFVDNPDQRTACVLVLDTSYSMVGEPIAELNDGLQTLQRELMEDPLARRRVELSILSFGGTVELVQDFVVAEEFRAPRLKSGGGTPMGEAIDRALDRVGMRKHVYEQHRIPFTRPWVFLITDGEPTDDWQRAAERVHRASAARQIAFFAIGVQGADMGVLRRIAAPERPPRRLAELRFQALFEWLSRSLGSVSRSSPGGQTRPEPTDGWSLV